MTRTPSGAAGDEAYCASCERSFPIHYNVCPNDGSRLAKLVARVDDIIGRVFDGRYEVRGALGAGGMGTVYRGCQLAVDRDVAIKVIHPSLASDRIAVKRFLREARLATRLAQANIVNVYDFGQDPDGTLYLVMELLRGKTLGEVLESGPMPTKRVVAIALQLCDALHAAHSEEIVHRDLKPGNIVVLDDPPGRDHVKVLDFGLAKSLVTVTSSQVTTSNAIVGTPLYMSPEQVECRPGDHRTDLYSLGCILHQMIAGTPLFLSDSPNLVLAAHLSEPPPPLPAGVHPLLAEIVRRLLEKAPADRPASALAVRELLERVAESSSGMNSGPAVALRPSLAPTQPQPVAVPLSVVQPRSVRRWLLVLAPLAIVVAGIAVYLSSRDVEPRPSTPAVIPAAVPDASTLVVEPIEPSEPIRPAPVPPDAGQVVQLPVDAAPTRRGSHVRDKPRRDARVAPPPAATPDASAADVDFIQPSP